MGNVEREYYSVTEKKKEERGLKIVNMLEKVKVKTYFYVYFKINTKYIHISMFIHIYN